MALVLQEICPTMSGKFINGSQTYLAPTNDGWFIVQRSLWISSSAVFALEQEFLISNATE